MFRKSLAWLLALCMVFALMPFSVFAEDGTSGIDSEILSTDSGSENQSTDSTNLADDTSDVTSNVTYSVSTKAELADAIANAQAGDVIELTADIDYGSDQLKIEKAIVLDLGGKTLTTRNAYGGMSLKDGPSIKNGTIVHASNTAAIKAWNVAAIEDVIIDVQGKGDANKTIGGIVIQENAVGIGTIKTVTIKGDALTNGIETYNCGNASSDVIGSMESVTIDANGTGMLISAPCGTATDCNIKGDVSGIEIWIKGTYNADLALVNCTVEGGAQAVYAHDEFGSNIVNSGTLLLEADAATVFTSENGVNLTLVNNHVSNITVPSTLQGGVAVVNGSYYETLAEAVAAANAVEGGATVNVIKDISLGEKLTISGNVTVTGAYTITRADDYTGTLFAVSAGATLTLDGGLVIDGGNNYAFDADAYKADLESYTEVSDGTKYFTPEEGAPIATAYMITVSGTVNLNNVTVKNNYSTGSGIVSASNGAVVTLTGAQITHNASTSGSGLVVNAAAGVYDVNGNNAIIVTMNDGTVIDGNHVGGNHGVFKVYTGTLFTMNGGEITDTTGWNSNGVAVGVYWAAFTMNGGTICSNSSVYGPNNGRNAAVYLHSASQFVMNGGTVCHNSGRSRGGIDAPYTGSTGNVATAVINGGTVTDNVSIYGNADPDVSGGERLTITGGTFTQDVSQWLAPDLGVSYNEATGLYTVNSDIWQVIFTVVDTDGVETSLDPQYFANLNDLLSYYKELVDPLDMSVVDSYSAAVKLMSDVKIDEIAVIDLPLTLDLNGKTVTAVTGESGYSDAFRILADVTVIGNGTVDADESGYAFFVGDDTTAGKLTIKNGSFYGATTAAQVTKGELIIEGGYFEATAYNGAYDFTLNCKDAFYQAGEAKITVTGGTFSNFNPADNKAEGTGTDFVAAGYVSVDNGDGTWSVVFSPVVSLTDSEGNVTYYPSIKDAFDTLSGADTTVYTVKVLKDFELDVNYSTYNYPILVNGFNVVLDLNGKTITADWSEYTGSRKDNALIGVVNGGKLTITGNGTINNLSDEKTGVQNRIFWIMNSTETKKTVLTIENGTFIQGDNVHLLYVQGDSNSSTNAGVEIYVKGGNYQMVGYTDFFNAYDGYKQYTELSGGTFTVDPTDWELNIADGFAVADNGDGTWGVVSAVASVTDSEENVTYYAALQEAIDAANSGDTVKLLCDITLTADDVAYDYNGATTKYGHLYVAADKNITLDLNGCKLENTEISTTVRYDVIVNEGTLKIVDTGAVKGVIASNNTMGNLKSSGGFVLVNLGTMVLDGVTIDGNTGSYAVITQNENTSLTVDNTIITGRGAINVYTGSKAIINSGTFTMDIATGNVQDNTVYVYNAEVIINGGTFTTGDITGTKRTAIAATGTSTVIIKGGNFYGLTADLYTKGEGVAINVSDGTFTGVGFDNQSGVISLTGGTYSYDPNAYCHADYAGIENGDGTWTVVKYVEWIKEQLLAGNDVTLIKDVVVDGSDIDSISAPTNGNGAYLNPGIFNVVGDYDVTFDLNGHTITYVGHAEYLCGVNDKFSGNSCKIAHGLFFANNGAKLTVKGEGNVIVHGVASGVYAASPNSVITVEGGNWYNDGCETCGASNFFLYASHGGELYIKGGRFEQALDSNGDSHLILEHGGSASNAVVDFSLTKIVVSGGTFVGMNPEEALYAAQNSWSSIEWGTTGVVAEGYYAISVEGEDNTWTIDEAVAINVETGKGYGDLSEALDSANANDTVKLLKNTEETILMIPADVKLDLNGNIVTATYAVIAFGHIVDGEEGGVGGIAISNDTKVARTSLLVNNEYLPIYDTENGCYRFYAYEFVNKGEKATGTNVVTFGVAIRFSNLDAYKLLANSEATGLSLTFELTIGEGQSDTMVFAYSEEGIKKWAEEAYNYYSDSSNVKDMALTLKISGFDSLPEGTVTSMKLVLTSEAGVIAVAVK